MSVMSKAKKKKNKTEDKATKVRSKWDPFALPSLMAQMQIAMFLP
jgi:hypothetical protein